MTNATHGFRYDINALRAIAVVSVVLFHFNEKWLPGGFVGVDVFFVISGYLMTAIVMSGLETKKFSLLGFYAARARRIFPALAALCATIVIFGYFFVIPKDYETLGRHALDSLLFISNFTYFSESGYFDASSHEKWLLHTWSLSVEWQFYLAYPVILLSVFKAGGRSAASIAAAGMLIASLIVCQYVSRSNPSAAFFLIPSRSWEMLAGSMAFFWPLYCRDSYRVFLSVLGWATIIGSCALIDSSMIWPGFLAVIPVIGTYLVIIANNKGTIASRNQLTQALGKYSYSLYLWHWPIIVAAAYLQIEVEFYAFAAAAITLAAGSFYLLEKRRTSIFSSLSALIAAALISGLALIDSGANWRVSPEFALTDQQYHSKFYGGASFETNKLARIGLQDVVPSAYFVGDSFGLQYVKGYEDIADRDLLGLDAYFIHGCFIAPSYTRYRGALEEKTCSDAYSKVISEINKHPGAPVVLAFSWGAYQTQLGKREGSGPDTFPSVEAYMQMLRSEIGLLIEAAGAVREYYLVGVPQPAEAYAFRCLARTELIGYRLIDECPEIEPRKKSAINDGLRNIAESMSSVTFIDPNDFLCSEGSCQIIQDRQPVHSDRSHLSIYGAEKVAPHILREAGVIKGLAPDET